MLTKKNSFFIVLAFVLLFSSFSNVYASGISSSEVDLNEKIVTYKLNMIEDTLKSGTNEITYHWTDIDGVSQSIDLVVIVNEEGAISSVKEKSISTVKEDGISPAVEKNISSTTEINDIKASIEGESLVDILAVYPDVPFKLNGGSTSSQFVNTHAFERHKYDKSVTSTSCSRTRYASDVGVSSLRSSTVAKPDEKFSTRVDGTFTTVYLKRFQGRPMNIMISGYGLTYWHRVITNHTDSSSSTHYPYCK